MTGNFKRCVELLEGNDEKVLGEARFVLTKLCENILNFPTNEKYRKVRLSNPIVMSKLLPASGAIECLFEAGFIEVIVAARILYFKYFFDGVSELSLI